MKNLPRRAAAKLTQLGIAADEATELAASTQRRIKDCEEAILVETDPDRMHDLQNEMTALKAARSNHQRRRDNLKAVLANIRHWMERLPPNVVLNPVQPILVRPKQGESVREALDRVRASVDGCKVELGITKQAAMPKADLKLEASAYVAGLIEKARPRVRATSDGLSVRFNDSLAGPPTGNDVAGILAYLDNGAALKKRLHAEIDNMDLANALSKDEKEARLTKLRSDLSKFEREEEALIELAIEQGVPVERRADANPANVLGVAIGKSPQAKPKEPPAELAKHMQRQSA